MHPGMDEDDKYIMVEDEFISTARLFTAHLHHASYRQHIKQAASRAKSAMTPIVRATVGDGKAKLAVQKQNEIEELRRKQKKGLVNMGLEDDDDPWMRNPLLKGLMGDENMGSVVKIGRYVRSQEIDGSPETGGENVADATDEDDLDAVPVRRKSSSASKPSHDTQKPIDLESSPPKSFPKRRELTGKLKERYNRSQGIREPGQDTRSTTQVQVTDPTTTSGLLSQQKEELDSSSNLPRSRQLKSKFAEKFKRTKAVSASQTQETFSTNPDVTKTKNSGPRMSDVPFFLI
jgi:hypothetical protein